MSAISVAKRDFLNVRRAKLVWLPIVMYVLFMLLFYWAQSQNPGGTADFYAIMSSLASVGGTLLIPLVAAVAAYLSIAGERESGSIKYQLSLPVSRSNVVLGKLLARTSIVAVGLCFAFAVGIAAAQLLLPEMEVPYDEYAVFVGLTLLYAIAYVAIAVAISAATGSRARAMGTMIGFFFIFNILWSFQPASPARLAERVFEAAGLEYTDHHVEFIVSLSPTGAYLNGLELAIPDANVIGEPTAATDPIYVQDWFMLIILAGWIVVPLLVGIARFNRSNLG